LNMFRIKVSLLKINMNIKERMNYVRKDGPLSSKSEDILMSHPTKLINSNLLSINNPFQLLLMPPTGNSIRLVSSPTVKIT